MHNLSTHSFMTPEFIRGYYKHIRGLLILKDSNQKYLKYYDAFLCNAISVSGNRMAQGLQFLFVLEMKKLMLANQISLDKYECTQIFR